MDNPLISIIVPVYNVEKYLEKCLNSIINQTYKNIEVILVDDGSTDKSGAICDLFEKKYNNVKTVHKNNEGLGYARNTGLKYILGDYVTFIDSDDWVSENLIANLYDALVSYKVDFCKSGFRRIKHNGDIVSVTHYADEVFYGDKVAGELFPRMIGSAPGTHDSIEMCVCCLI